MKRSRFTLYVLRFTFYALFPLLLLLAFPSPAQAQGDTSSAVPRFEPSDCPFAISNGRTVDCGYLVVAADHFNPGDATFRLAVSILRSSHANPLPEPILFLNGGPGAETAFIAGVEGLPLMADSRWDMIFLDQRGIGFSEPNLNCPSSELESTTGLEVTGGGAEILEQLTAARLAAVQACYDALQGYDLSLFSSAQITADAADLQQALNIESLNIYAFSYGTIPAQLLLREYPQGIRAVILDSPVALGTDFYSASLLQTHAAFQSLFAACRQDLACRVAYPDLETKLEELVGRLNREPITLTLAVEERGTAVTQVVTGDLLAGYLGSMVNSVSNLVRLPSLIYELSEGDTTQLTALVGPALAQPLGVKNGLTPSIFCQEFIGPETAVAVQKAAEALPPLYTQTALDTARFDQSLCEIWQTGTTGPRHEEPASGQTPTLVLSGQYDFGSSLDSSEGIADKLENGYFFAIPGVGHSVLGQQCPVSIALAFLVAPNSEPPHGCLESMEQPTLIINQSASRPWARTAVLLLTLSIVVAAGGGSLSYLREGRTLKLPPFTWRTTLRLINWLPTVVGAVLIALAMISSNGGRNLFDISALSAASVLGVILPLVTAVQAALIFSPEDEPGLEILLTVPRPVAWTALERLALVLLAQLVIGLAGTLIGRTITGTDEALWVTLVRWLVPVIFFAGLGLMITQASRHVIFGIMMSAISWFTLSILGDSIIIRWPFLWPLHLFLKPETLTLEDYTLNRGIVLAFGLLMLIRAVYFLRDEEQVLFGRSPTSRSPVAKEVKARSGLTNVVVIPQIGFNPGWYLAQIGSIARAELRLQWRRRATLVMMLTLLVFPIMTALLLGNDTNETVRVMVEAGIYTAEEARNMVARSVAPFTFAPIYMTLLLMVPPIAAELIPKDRQLGVSELLESTPLTTSVYLAGKVLGFWVSSLAGLTAIMLISMAAWRVILGPFAVMPVLEMWLIGSGAIIVINGGLSVLLAAGQRSRRWAALIGLLIALLSLMAFSTAIGSTTADFFYYNNLSRPALLDYYMLASLRDSITTKIVAFTGPEDIWLVILAGFAQLLLVGCFMWGWLEYKHGK